MRATLPFVLLLAGACTGGAPEEVPTFRVEAAGFVHRVTAEGHLAAARATPLVVPSTSRGGFLVAWVAEEGRAVAAGEAVIRFDPTELEKTLADARADRTIVDYKTARERAANAARVSSLDRDASMAEAELELLSAFRKRDEELYSRFEIVESEIDADLAAAREEHAIAARRSQGELGRTELERLGIERQRAQMKIDQAEEALNALEIVAPHAGLLIFERDRQGQPPRVGDAVFTGQKLAEIPDLAEMMGEVWVLEADAGGLEVDKAARVVVESRPGTVFGARVERVDSLARPRVPGSPVQYFGVSLKLERTDPEVMKPGQRITAEILLAQLDRALTVPRQAVFEGDDGPFVHRRTAEGFERRAVTLSAASLGRVVVTGGLAAGDVVALRDPEQPSPELASSSRQAGATTGAAGDGGLP